MKKGNLKKFIDKKFNGNYWEAANKMVVLFCEKYDIPGSSGGYSLYESIQEAWRKELEKEKEKINKWQGI